MILIESPGPVPPIYIKYMNEEVFKVSVRPILVLTCFILFLCSSDSSFKSLICTTFNWSINFEILSLYTRTLSLCCWVLLNLDCIWASVFGDLYLSVNFSSKISYESTVVPPIAVQPERI